MSTRNNKSCSILSGKSSVKHINALLIKVNENERKQIAYVIIVDRDVKDVLIESKDLESIYKSFSKQVFKILNSKDAWTSVYPIDFVQVPNDCWQPGILRIRLCSNKTIQKKCSFNKLSCYSRSSKQDLRSINDNIDHIVYINELNWNCTSDACVNAGYDTDTPEDVINYRKYVILHEVGHSLGFDHLDCPGANKPIPIMAQQSKSETLQDCKPNTKVYLLNELKALSPNYSELEYITY